MVQICNQDPQLYKGDIYICPTHLHLRIKPYENVFILRYGISDNYSLCYHHPIQIEKQ